MSRCLLIILLALSGCTVSVVDSRLTREEVASALAERDAAIKSLAEMIKQIVTEGQRKGSK